MNILFELIWFLITKDWGLNCRKWMVSPAQWGMQTFNDPMARCEQPGQLQLVWTGVNSLKSIANLKVKSSPNIYTDNSAVAILSYWQFRPNLDLPNIDQKHPELSTAICDFPYQPVIDQEITPFGLMMLLWFLDLMMFIELPSTYWYLSAINIMFHQTSLAPVAPVSIVAMRRSLPCGHGRMCGRSGHKAKVVFQTAYTILWNNLVGGLEHFSMYKIDNPNPN